MNIQRGNQRFKFMASSGIQLVLQLYQLICRLHKEHILSGGEVADHERFLMATEGNYDIMSVPFAEEAGWSGAREQISEKLDAMGIRYHILPRLDEKSQTMKVCVYSKDVPKFGTFFREHLADSLSGGQQKEQDLLAFTGGQASLISVTGEDKVNEICADLDRIHVNYARMPDLFVGDDRIQFLVSNADLSKVKHWYGQYKEMLLKSGREAELSTMTMEEYQDTGKLTPEQ